MTDRACLLQLLRSLGMKPGEQPIVAGEYAEAERSITVGFECPGAGSGITYGTAPVVFRFDEAGNATGCEPL